MPAKVVYGKKKTATRAETSFTKFISPEKDGITAKKEDAGRHGGMKEGDWRAQLEIAATGGGEVGAMEALEMGLEGMRLEEVKNAKKARAWKVLAGQGTFEKKENEDPGEGVLKSREEEARKKTAVRTPKGERRGRVEQDAQPTVDAVVNVLEPRSTREKGRKPMGDSHSSPTKVRQPTSRSRPKHRRPPSHPSLPTPESTPQPDDVYSAYASPLLSMSDTKMIQPFDEWSTELESHFSITKIAEASFSEVYRLSTLNASGTSAQESVLKLIALKTPPNVPLPCQSTTRTIRDRKTQLTKERAERSEKEQWKSEVPDVLSEVNLLQNLNHIPGFTDFRDLTILSGRPTPFFATAWKSWNKSRARGKKSEFPDPSKKSSYEDTQLWAVIEMQDAGTDVEKLMEAGVLSTIWEVWDVFWGTCLSVAKAEETCRFEHRDLHLGNICVRSVGDVRSLSVVDDVAHRKLRFTGLETTVIDYTLSRADILDSSALSRRTSSSTLTASSSSSDIDPTPNTAFFDLDKDPAVFEGDAREEYQYEIYRYMRNIVLYNNPLQSTPTHLPPLRTSPRKNTHIRFNSQSSSTHNPWRTFHPKTNLIWAHYLLHKLLLHLKSCGGDEKLCKKAGKLLRVLERVRELLCPVVLGREGGLGGVRDLVVGAVGKGWLGVGDVSG